MKGEAKRIKDKRVMEFHWLNGKHNVPQIKQIKQNDNQIKQGQIISPNVKICFTLVFTRSKAHKHMYIIYIYCNQTQNKTKIQNADLIHFIKKK